MTQQVSLSYPSTSTMATDDTAQQAVRFKLEHEQAGHRQSLQPVESLTSTDKREREDLGPEAQEELRNLAVTLQKSQQQRRLENFAFEPVSLPPSRVSDQFCSLSAYEGES